MFHVPETARIRKGSMGSTESAGNNGAFFLVGTLPGRELWVIASDELGWEHVSVHGANRTGKLFLPNWEEMCYVKALFCGAEDAVMQLHPPQSQWVNNHAYTLHLWRPVAQTIPLPHSMLVGLKALNGVSLTPEQGGAIFALVNKALTP